MPSPSLAALPAVRSGRSPRRAHAAATAAVTLAAALAACAGPAAATPVDDVVVFPVTVINVIQLESLTYTPELIAQVAGLFEREHLKVSFEFNKGSAEAIQNVLGGSGLLTRVGDKVGHRRPGRRRARLSPVSGGRATRRRPGPAGRRG
jgi:NitT/TauT family transport system substrate-binding protein